LWMWCEQKHSQIVMRSQVEMPFWCFGVREEACPAREVIEQQHIKIRRMLPLMWQGSLKDWNLI
jgi:hypothetical protein